MKKIYRLKKNEEIAKIVHRRQRIGRKNFTVYYQYSKKEIPQIAISVSKKLGNAVTRNHIKRIIREIIRPSIKLLNNIQMVVVAKNGINEEQFAVLKTELNEILRKIRTGKGEINEEVRS